MKGVCCLCTNTVEFYFRKDGKDTPYGIWFDDEEDKPWDFVLYRLDGENEINFRCPKCSEEVRNKGDDYCSWCGEPKIRIGKSSPYHCPNCMIIDRYRKG